MRCRSARYKRCLEAARGGMVGTAAVLLLTGGAHSTMAAEAGDRHPMDSVLEMMNLKADPGQAPDFVQKTRPGSTDYIPIGRKHPERVIKPKSAADVKASEAELDAARARQEQVAAQPAAPMNLAPVKRAPGKKPPAAPLRGTQN